MKKHIKKATSLLKKISLFPRYFFIKLEESFVSLNTINSTYGVLKILMFGRKPSIVSDKIIDELKRNCTTNDVFMNVPKFQAGDKVIFTNSPFASFVGKIQKVDASYRICVLLDYIGKKFNIISINQNLQKIKTRVIFIYHFFSFLQFFVQRDHVIHHTMLYKPKFNHNHR